MAPILFQPDASQSSRVPLEVEDAGDVGRTFREVRQSRWRSRDDYYSRGTESVQLYQCVRVSIRCQSPESAEECTPEEDSSRSLRYMFAVLECDGGVQDPAQMHDQEDDRWYHTIDGIVRRPSHCLILPEMALTRATAST